MWLVGHWGLSVRSRRFIDKEKGNYMKELQQMGKNTQRSFYMFLAEDRLLNYSKLNSSVIGDI